MANWTDKDTFKLMHDTRDSYFHVILPGVQNDLKQYATAGNVLPIRTNGEVITAWSSNNTINVQPVNRVALAEMIRKTKPKEDSPILVISIPEIDRPDIGMVIYCWMHLNTANTMQLYHTSGTTKATAVFSVPATDNDPVNGFSTNCIIKQLGTPRIYYDWRETLTPITSYFKAVIKYCKETGKTRRLAEESANRALNDRNAAIQELISKNTKRFKGIPY